MAQLAVACGLKGEPGIIGRDEGKGGERSAPLNFRVSRVRSRSTPVPGGLWTCSRKSASRWLQRAETGLSASNSIPPIVLDRSPVSSPGTGVSGRPMQRHPSLPVEYSRSSNRIFLTDYLHYFIALGLMS
jgi:hypothetical protein